MIQYNTIQYNFIAKWNEWTAAGEVDKTEQLQRKRTHLCDDTQRKWKTRHVGEYVFSGAVLFLLPSVDTIARGMFCGAKYTHHTFITPIIKH